MRRPNGQAAEPPLKIGSREELVYLLGEACELEHGLACEYLYAQFSLKRSLEEGVTQRQLERIQAWEQTVIDVTKQEMLHLALATNILTALGAAPHFERPNFPILSRWYPPDVQIALVPFGERALRHFMFLERPEGMVLNDAAGFEAVKRAQPMTVEDQPLMGEPQEWHTVGHLYREIEAGLTSLCDRYGEKAVFIGPPQAQAVTDIFEWKELIAITELRSARQAIDAIVEQGEGARGDWVKSHFGKFVGILEDYLRERAADPNFNPARPVEPAYVQLPPDVDAGVLIEDRLTARVADLFDALYELNLQVLSRYYVHHGETHPELDTLATTAKHLMNWVMRKLGPVLTNLPIGPSALGKTCGPPFNIVRPAFYVLPHRGAAWRIIKERLDELAERCEVLSREPALATLQELSGNLHSMAADVGKHIDTRTRTGSRSAP